MIAKRRNLHAAAALALAACGAAAAQAQTQLVPRASVIAAFGACAARQSPDAARALLATPVDGRAERRAARRFAGNRSGCVRRGFASHSMHSGELRGAVAEALIEQDAGALARLRAMPPGARVRAEAAEGRAFLVAFGRCIADADPAGAARLLETEPASAGEHAAFLAFGDILGECLPLNQTYTINRFDVRSHIAMRLYDIAFPPAAAGAGQPD